MPKKTSEQQEFFMRINNPNTFRRNLLEASKDTLNILKQIYNVRQIREVKQELINRINKEIGELKVLVQKIDELMPQHTKEELIKKFPELSFKKKSKEVVVPERTMEKAKPKAKPGVEKHVSEIEKLSKAIDEVQKRLQNL